MNPLKKNPLKKTLAAGLIFTMTALFAAVANANCPDILNHEFRKLHSADTFDLCEVNEAKAVLIVNTASHCGFTGQFSGLEALHQKYREQGLVVLGFPSNDFRQEAGDESATANVCYINYGVTFGMSSPISVRGDSAHPLFRELADRTREPSWNFNKYLLNPNDQSVIHFGSSTKPESDKLVSAVEALL